MIGRIDPGSTSLEHGDQGTVDSHLYLSSAAHALVIIYLSCVFITFSLLFSA